VHVKVVADLLQTFEGLSLLPGFVALAGVFLLFTHPTAEGNKNVLVRTVKYSVTTTTKNNTIEKYS
jgi:hypothetical protein